MSPSADITDLLDELRQAAEAVLLERDTYTPSIVEYAVQCLNLLEDRQTRQRTGPATYDGVSGTC